MAKIVQVSRAWRTDKHYGFKLDSLKNDWTKVDKALLKSSLFHELKVGDNIQILARDKRGFVTEIKKLDPFFVDVCINNLPCFTMSFEIGEDE